jgi:leader peptidase (prepilin peptidase)/N-methyltransferase
MLEILLLFILGSIIGSFLNVCIYRLPVNLSLWKPRSFCPHCKKRIALWNNIPIISYLLLKGKCAHCKSSISVQYVLVEVLTGIITVLSYEYYALSNMFIIYSVFMYFLIVIGFIDLKTRLIYNRVLVSLLLFAIIAQTVSPFTQWPNALLGILTGGGAMLLVSLLGKVLLKKESLGMGDVKLAAVAGFFLGWQNILIAVYTGFVFALITMMVINSIKRTRIVGYIPLGPFLALGIITFIFWGQDIVQIYLSLVI